jgi:hypothetical protein
MDATSGALQLTENAIRIGRAYYSIYDVGTTDIDTINYITSSGAMGTANSVLINLNDATLDRTTVAPDIAKWIADLQSTTFYGQLSSDLQVEITDANHFAGGFFSRVLTSSGGTYSALDGGYSIANGTIIDNATGGSKDDILIGNEQGNDLTGNGGNDVLDGAAGDDELKGGAGNDTLFGGAGRHDEAIYTGAYANYTITHNPDKSVTISNLAGAGPDGTDTLRDVECAIFTDRHVPLDPLTGPFDIVFLQDLTGSFTDDSSLHAGRCRRRLGPADRRFSRLPRRRDVLQGRRRPLCLSRGRRFHIVLRGRRIDLRGHDGGRRW